MDFRDIKEFLIDTIKYIATAVVVIFVSIYFLDVYKVSANINDFNNEYEDSYWENLEENGFVAYETYKEKYEALKEEVTPKTVIIPGALIAGPQYVAPYEETDSNIEKINSARFNDEVSYIFKVIKTSNPDIENDAAFMAAYENISSKLSKVTRNDYLLSLSKELVLSNDKYNMYFDYLTTQFSLEQKDSEGNVIETWSSNPSVYDKAEGINKKQKSIFTITCVDGNKASTKTPIEYDSFTFSTNENVDKAIEPTYYVNVVNDSNGNPEKVIVYYTLERKGIDATYLPSTISLPRLRELIQRCNQLVKEYKENNNGEYAEDSSGTKITELGFMSEISGINPATGQPFPKETINFYSRVVDTNYKRIQVDKNNNELPLEEQYFELISSPSQTAIGDCYRFFYEWCGYQLDELVIDTGVENQVPTTPKINVALEYKLGENGLEVMVPGNSIKTNANATGDKYLVTSMEILPYFTSLKSDSANKEEGYLVIPDGSGAVMEFNNGKTNYNAYSKRIYTSDLTFTSYTLTADTSDMLLPMYGYVFTGPTDADKRAMVVEALDGAAQVSLYADTANRGQNSFYNI